MHYEIKKKESKQVKKNLVDIAIEQVVGFSALLYRFIRSMLLTGKSKRTIAVYCSHIATISLHFGRTPLDMAVEEVHDFLFSLQNRSKTLSQTYFKHTLEDGLDIMTLKDLMGHSSIQTTMKYLLSLAAIPFALSVHLIPCLPNTP